MRTTRKEVESLFESLCATLGKRVATAWNDVGAWSLDYNPHYGGYVIIEQMEHGESAPYGDYRRSAGDMAYTIRFALRSIQLDRNPVNTAAYWPDPKSTEAQ
jgi:hypothetical protein